VAGAKARSDEQVQVLTSIVHALSFFKAVPAFVMQTVAKVRLR
jgi:hypothetical protein